KGEGRALRPPPCPIGRADRARAPAHQGRHQAGRGRSAPEGASCDPLQGARRRSRATIVLGSVKRWVLAMLAGPRPLRVAPIPAQGPLLTLPAPLWNPEPVGTKGVPPFAPLRGSPRLRRVEQRAEPGTDGY